MSRLKFYKKLSLPENLDENSIYFVKEENEEDVNLYVTDNSGNNAYLVNKEKLYPSPRKTNIFFGTDGTRYFVPYLVTIGTGYTNTTLSTNRIYFIPAYLNNIKLKFIRTTISNASASISVRFGIYNSSNSFSPSELIFYSPEFAINATSSSVNVDYTLSNYFFLKEGFYWIALLLKSTASSVTVFGTLSSGTNYTMNNILSTVQVSFWSIANTNLPDIAPTSGYSRHSGTIPYILFGEIQ